RSWLIGAPADRLGGRRLRYHSRMSRAVRSTVWQIGIATDRESGRAASHGPFGSLGRAAAGVSPDVDTGGDGGLVARRPVLLAQRLGVEGRDIVLELLNPAGADDQGRHAFVAQCPGQRHLRQRLTASTRDVIEAADAREVVLAEEAVSE